MTMTPNTLINTFIKEETPVIVFLVNGVKLQGCITSRDEIGLTLKRGTVAQAIFHGAVSTIMPQAPIEAKSEPVFVAAGGGTL